MKEFRGKVAVVTGSASGIGRALAQRFAAEGMDLLLADIEQEPLDQVASGLLAGGTEVLAVRTNVSDASEMDRLGEATFARYGAVHLVCNNAGVGTGGTRMWDLSQRDWEFVLGPNLWGVIHGVRVFAKHLVAQNEGHIVNTASIAGLFSTPTLGPYNVSKYGVVALTETLAAELKATGSKVGASVLCPGFVATRIAESARHRTELERAALPGDLTSRAGALLSNGMAPALVAEHVLEAVIESRLYILTHPEMMGNVERRMQNIFASVRRRGSKPPESNGANQ